jgi:type I restriction enzyme S subunit
MSFPRYPKYKDSGVEWLGEVPEGWDVTDGRRLFQQDRTPALPDDEQLSATQKYGVIPQKLFMELQDQKVTLALSGLDNFKHVDQGDFVISLRSFQGGIEQTALSGCVSPAYTVLKPASSLYGRFWNYLLKSRGYIDALQSMNDGIRDGKSISYGQFGQIPVPQVPLPEQTAIAAFLDRETAKIDALVAEQRRLMELLKEKRQAVISHAVTKGLNPDAPMKPSGIEWLGDVPEHWESTSIKNICYINDGNHGEQYPNEGDFVPPEEGVPFIRAGDFENFKIIAGNLKYISQEKNDSMRKGNLQENDILFVNRGATIGKVCAVGGEYVGSNLNSQIAYLRVNETKFSYRYLLYYLSGAFIQQTVIAAIHGGALPQFPIGNIVNLAVVHPPQNEQHEIGRFVEKETARLDTLTAEAQRAIDLLQERRTALISAAVTGQIDVRQLVPTAFA